MFITRFGHIGLWLRGKANTFNILNKRQHIQVQRTILKQITRLQSSMTHDRKHRIDTTDEIISEYHNWLGVLVHSTWYYSLQYISKLHRQIIKNTRKLQLLFTNTKETKASRMHRIFQTTHQTQQSRTQHGSGRTRINQGTTFPFTIQQHVNLRYVTTHRLMRSNVKRCTSNISKTILLLAIAKVSGAFAIRRVGPIVFFKLLFLLGVPSRQSSAISGNISRIGLIETTVRTCALSGFVSNGHHLINNFKRLKITQQRHKIFT